MTCTQRTIRFLFASLIISANGMYGQTPSKSAAKSVSAEKQKQGTRQTGVNSRPNQSTAPQTSSTPSPGSGSSTLDQGSTQATASIPMGSSYAGLLKSLDIYASPPNAKKLLSLPELFLRVQSKGVALKVSKETLNSAKQTLKTENDKKIPVVSMTLGHNQSWSKTKQDSDFTDTISDREGVASSHSSKSNAGLSLTGSPVQGVDYSLSFPDLAHTKQSPDTSTQEPERPDNAAFNSKIGVALLKDNPFSSESLNRRKTNLTISSAKETFKLETLKTLIDAETKYYGLVQKYLQLAVQERSNLLAKILEKEVKEKIAVGESSPLEATSAELQTAQSEIELMTSQIDYGDATEEFRESLSFDDSEGQGVFPDPKSLDIDVEKLQVPQNGLEEVRKSNPEIIVSRIAKQAADVDLSLAKNSSLPSLSLDLNYGNSTPGNGWGKTAAEALKPNDRVFSVGLSYTQVIFNDTSKNAVVQAAVARQKADFAAEETSRRIAKDYKSLIKKIEIGSRRYKIAKISREIAEKKLNSEYEKFKAGESNVRNVIDTQTEVNSSRITEIGARVEILLSHAQLRNMLGKLPEGMNF